MKTNIVFIAIVAYLLISCSPGKSKIYSKDGKIEISDPHAHYGGIELLLNQSKLKKISSTFKNEEATVRYSDSLKYHTVDLQIKLQKSDSMQYLQFTASFPQKIQWLQSDSLQLVIQHFDSITNGIYSEPYAPVYAWCSPHKFSSFNQITNSSSIQMAYWKYVNGTYGVALPMGGNSFSVNLRKDESGFGAVAATSSNGLVSGNIPLLAIASSADIYSLLPSVYANAFQSMGIEKNLRRAKQKPEMYNYLGWASWNALMTDVSESKIEEAAKSLKDAGIPVKWILIDDGWLDVTDNKLNGYQPNPLKFPNGFHAITSTLKNEYQISEVGVWHTLNGYWEGLNPQAKLTKELKDTLHYTDRIVWLSEKDKQMTFVDPFKTEGYSFYDNWYTYLKEQGITFVKVDNQLVAKKIARGNFPQWETSEKLFENLHQAANKHFNGNVINCMNMINEDFYHYGNLAVARTVEDYFPADSNLNYKFEFRGNAAAHVLASVHNSFWLSNMVWPDYDMFQSNRPDAWFYAIAKVMSSGPVYITDEAGKHNTGLVKAICLDNGKVVVADRPCRPTEDCLFQLFDSDQPFKSFSTFRDNGLIAAWNVSDKETVEGTVKISDINGLQNQKYLAFEFFTKETFLMESKTQMPVKLGRLDCKFYSLIPIEKEMAVIGNIHKVIPMATVSDVKINDKSLNFKALAKGKYWVYFAFMPKEIVINGEQYKPVSYSNNIIELDVEKENATINIFE